MTTGYQSNSNENGAHEDIALYSGAIDRAAYVRQKIESGLTLAEANAEADNVISSAINQRYNRNAVRSSYDYIVVGSGSAGSVIARRLIDSGKGTVLLLEAGGSDQVTPVMRPELWYTNPGSTLEWGHVAMPQTHVNGRAVPLTMGKVIGGGSSINVMAWVRGHKTDFDNWAAAADDPKWGYKHVLEIYKRIENWQGKPDPEYRGVGGPVWVETAKDPIPLAHAMVQACDQVGIPAYEDHNGVMNERDAGAAICNVLIRDGRRHSIPSAYLHPVLHDPKLTVLTGAEVHRVTMEGKQVTGVQFFWNGQLHMVSSTCETILSAGALNTPRILMCSGIGDPSKLNPHGILVRHALPGVGENFQDHPILAGINWEYKEGSATPPRNNLAEAMFAYKTDPSLDQPDILPWLFEVPYASEVNSQIYPLPAAGWGIHPGLMHAKSRGRIHLSSNDPRDRLRIESNFLEDPEDIQTFVRAFDICRQVANAPAMDDFRGREITPNLKGDELVNFIRNGVITYRHQTCTCKMGTDEMSVVDNNLKVYGLEGLRIADGSIMPEVTGSNTMAPCVIIGERMSEILISQ
ncbi:GMC family oxidoreductase N-terminal domain-containing protein (plasmid) [Rhizobium sp. CB3090]|uniref:GMC family oxidoreductase n=1 Tax=Rhizobium sp. CB3090 TaxID=3039156 RepID=UPI0024B0CBB5|nr:GMC family oxidoreductase N-terminal domain-containing protein [Rhizobium sp. CB3090]WFU12893.1 GMC family oxidoreductase N-terminal domain-containing protein [Rhizobium sp. CB3090]